VISGECGLRVSAEISRAIATVGIVEWSSDLARVDEAHVDFGLDTQYGLVAPVDLAAPRHRTLLLGMKAAHDYHARLVVKSGGEVCRSEDFTLTTGALLAGLPPVTVTTTNPGARAGGYIISSFLGSLPPFILDADGDYVWWGVGSEFGRAEMTFDGHAMWFTRVNVGGGSGYVGRLSMDGLVSESFPEFGDAHHDLTVLPDETVGFIQHDADDRCDTIMERAPDGSVRKIVNVHDAHGGGTQCHTNSIHYHPSDDTYTFSDLFQNAYVKVKRDGEVVWILGGTTSDFGGDGATWTRQHGHDLIAPDRLLFFNNQAVASPAVAVELSLDFETMTAMPVWSFQQPDLGSAIYGDVQRLENGNTLVTYSTMGVWLELDAQGQTVQRLEFPKGRGVGYSMQRPSLYGPPPVQ